MTESESLEGLPVSLDQEPESSLQIYREVFDLCDKDGNGVISKEELSTICQQVSDEDMATSLLENVLQCLDSDHDGNISFDEFKAGFQAFQHLQSDGFLPNSDSAPLQSSSTPRKPSTEEVYESEPAADEEESAWREVAERIDPLGNLKGTGVSAVWKEMNRRDPALLENFEGFLTEVISELKQSDLERSTLQNHVKRIMEQHSKEVSEMDDLLQEELQLAKATQQQNNESRTSRLSSHYTSLLAEREAVIEELATNEMDLKRALEEKAINESELKQEKNLLLTANRVLKEQLDTTGSSSEGHSRQSSEAASMEAGRAGGREESCDSDSDQQLQGDTVMEGERREEVGGRVRENGGEVLSDAIRTVEAATTAGPAPPPSLPFGPAPLPEPSLRLQVVQENEDTEQEEIKYFPPKKFQSVGSPSHMEDSTVQALARRQLTPDQQDSRESRDSFTTATEHSHRGTSAEHSQSGALSLPDTSLGSKRSSTTGHSGGVASTVTDLSFTVSGVMPRRTELPSPSSHLVNRVFKVVFLGESGVGKSTLIAFLTEGYYCNTISSTVGLDYKIKMLHVGDERVIFQLWDTAGQERFHNALTPVYFRRADAFVIVYDVTDMNSFKATKKWVSVIKAALREQSPVIMLVGNKSDRAGERCVTIEDGRRLALELQAMFSETSALSGDNVLQAHSTLAQLLLARENADLQEMKKPPLPDRGKSKCGC